MMIIFLVFKNLNDETSQGLDEDTLIDVQKIH